MPALKPSRFTSYEFTEQEYKSAAVLNPLQKMHLLTKQCEIAESLLNVEATSDSEIREAEIQRAFLKGQLAILAHLLEVSESMELNIREEDIANASTNGYIVDRPQQDHNLFSSNQPSDGE